MATAFRLIAGPTPSVNTTVLFGLRSDTMRFGSPW